ncbi:MAG TPA: hypothetical protein VJZ03_03710 [Candidatus Bathyarchaeia archaeon]|nr:hypothetical protein [Candidatus Bathyarchaeia archaeon]
MNNSQAIPDRLCNNTIYPPPNLHQEIALVDRKRDTLAISPNPPSKPDTLLQLAAI